MRTQCGVPVAISKCLLSALLVSLCLGTVAQGDEDPSRLKLVALIQEGDLILEEARALEPTTDRLTEEGMQLDTAERAVRVDSEALNRSIGEFNAAVAALDTATQERRARCPRDSGDAALVASCNASALELKAAAEERAEERVELQSRQATLNQRIEQQNAARRGWAKRKQDHDPRVQLNRSDLKDWLDRASAFFASNPFKALATRTKNPPACEPERIGSLSGLPPVSALRQALDCLKAVKAGGA